MSDTKNPDTPLTAVQLPVNALQQATVDHLLRVFGKIMQFATADWINLDLSSAQIKVLNTVYYAVDQNGYTVNQLADRLNVGASTASHLIDKLVQAGLAVRVDSPDDRRIVHVRLSEAGNEMARTLWGARGPVLTAWVRQLAPDDLAALNQGIHALRLIAQDSTYDPSMDA